jgi:ribonucleoside-diphosphate reductase alpha chain
MIFKYGSGSGLNVSTIRSSRERLAGGGTASGPVSFMRAADASAGVIKSGGKCFKRGTLVATPEGWRPIESLQIGELVLTHKGARPIADFMPNGLKLCYRIRTREGYEVEVTEGHQFAFWNAGEGRFETRPIEQFEPGDPLYLLTAPSEGGETIPLVIPEADDPPHATTTAEMAFPKELSEEFAYVLGLMYGDGELRTDYPYRIRVAFGKNPADQDAAARFRTYAQHLFGEAPILLGDETGHQQWGFTRKRLVEFLVANGLAKGKAAALHFPEVLFRAYAGVRAAFIAGMIDADGTYQARGGWVISCIDRDFLIHLQRLLLSLGIPSKVKVSRHQRGTWKTLYRLHIVGHVVIERLVYAIAPHSSKVQFHYAASDGADKGWGYRPSLFAPLMDRVEQRGGHRLVERTVGRNETTGYGALARLATHPDVAVAEYARELTQCVQVTLESIEPTEVAETYDIEVEDVHLLSANGFYASNTRRAAKMVVLNADHPDVKPFILCKWKEEEKAHKLIDLGYDPAIDGEAYASVFFQNANNSVRVTDDFMRRALADEEWDLKAVTTGEVIERVKARDLLRLIAEATWHCGDPGMQFDTTINDWHTCPNTGPITASNPCSEYLHLDDSACNLASINLMKFLDDEGNFLIEQFRYAVRVLIIAQDLIVDNSSYPTPKIERTARDYRQLGLGYANLGALLMSQGVAYDSEEGRAWAGVITALLCGHAYEVSGEIAAALGPYAGFARNREPQVRVLRKHRAQVDKINHRLVPEPLLKAATRAWDEAIRHGEQHGVRNSQVTVLAPTGTISFLLDCDTTGIEPDIALIKYKRLVGGGMLKIVNQTVPKALQRLGYEPGEIEAILKHLHEQETVEGTPGLKPEHLNVFDCAFRPMNGTRSIHYMGHVRMMGAVQPFISGAISKTVNMPQEATVEDIMQAYTEAWRLGIKAIAIYRDGSKRVQPLSTSKDDKTGAAKAPDGGTARQAGTPYRRRLPDERQAVTHKFSVGGHEGYLTVGLFEDGTPGEIFITMSKEGSTLSGVMDCFATTVSLSLQYGVPLKVLVNKFSHVRFEPAGVTNHKDIRFAKSVIDYIFRWMALKFFPAEEAQQFRVTEAPSSKSSNGSGSTAVQPATPGVSTPKTQKVVRMTGGGTAETVEVPITNLFEQQEKLTFVAQADAPACTDCGSLMVRNGNCYKCVNCGSTSGCS